MTERTHIAASIEPIVIEARAQLSTPGFKPVGFWYEVDGDWQRWCLGEMPGWVSDRYVHRVELGDERMLDLSTPASLLQFTRDYGVAHDYIDWTKVAAVWDGIEIAPYQWSQRLDLLWYYGWDCASGCVWRPRGATTELLRAEPLAVPA